MEIEIPVASRIELRWRLATENNTIKVYLKYVKDFPESPYTEEAKRRILNLIPPDRTKLGVFEFRMDFGENKGKYIAINPKGEIGVYDKMDPGSAWRLRYKDKVVDYLFQKLNNEEYLNVLLSGEINISVGEGGSGLWWNLIDIEEGGYFLIKNFGSIKYNGYYLTSGEGGKLIMTKDPLNRNTWWYLKEVGN